MRDVVDSLAEDVGLELVVFNAARVVHVDDLEEGVDVLALNRNLELGNEVGHFVDGEVATLVQIEIVEDLSKEGGVAASQLENAGLDLTEKVRHGLLGDLGVLLLGHLPDGLHHADEVLIGGGAHGEVGVVGNELLVSDDAVVVTSSSVEVVQEVGENLVSGLAALEELRVHGHVVDAADVVDFELTGAVLVEHSESLLNHSFAAGGQIVSKFIKNRDGYV